MEERMMADESRKLSITYSSGLIPPPEIMSTLAVFQQFPEASKTPYS